MLTGSIIVTGPSSVPEPTVSGTTTMVDVTISLASFSYPDSGTVHWQAEGVSGGATAGSDFTAASGTVNLSYMNQSVHVYVPVLYDTLSEASEGFRVVLSNATGNLGIMVSSVTINIIDNNPPPPPPPPPPPQIPTVNFATGSQPYFLAEGGSRELHVTRNVTTGPLTVYYVITEESVATEHDVDLAPAGSVTFAAGASGATITIDAIDDSWIEVHEILELSLVQFPAPNQGPGAYVVGSAGEYALDIRDNDEVIFSDLTVDWLRPDDEWESSPDSEMLWQEDSLRWTVTLPSEAVPFISELTQLPTLVKRPHEYPGTGWGPVSFQEVEQNPNNPAQFFIYANPGVGDWDISVSAVFVNTVFAWLEEPVHRPATGFSSTEWVKSALDPDLRLGKDLDDAYVEPIYSGPRVYTEYYTPIEITGNTTFHNRLAVKVKLLMAPPEGFVADVYFKDFDPDSPYHPATPDDAAAMFDINDTVEELFPATPEQPASYQISKKPRDNRNVGEGAGGARPTGGFFYDSVKTIGAGQTEVTSDYGISPPQPGNNFLAVVRGRQEWMDTVDFASDGITLLWKPDAGPVSVNAVTNVLTVWRTLHIERDSMQFPTTEDLGEFGAVDPKVDVGNPSIALLAPEFARANIDVQADLGEYDVKDDKFFMHYLDVTDPFINATAQGGANASRDVQNNFGFWVVQVIGAYEGSEAEDFDPHAGASWAGVSMSANNPVSFIFHEVIRERSSFDPMAPGENPLLPKSVPFAELEGRVVLHEVAHHFLGGHEHSANGALNPDHFSNLGPLKPSNNFFGTPDENHLTLRQLAEIQSQSEIPR